MWGFRVFVVAMLLAVGGVADSRETPKDIECGTPEWRPFFTAVQDHCKKTKADYACDVVSKAFATCKHPDNAEYRLKPIPAKDAAKGKFMYKLPGLQEWFEIRFEKTKGGWSAKARWCSSAGAPCGRP